MTVHKEFTTEVRVAMSTFEVKGCHRDWNPLPGYTPPAKTVWVVTTELWNRRVAVRGNSKEEALQELEQFLRRHMERSF